MTSDDFLSKKHSLTIMDIDDTLFRTTAKISVVRDGAVVKRLTNQEFNDYQLQPGESFDYGEFKSADKFNRESEPIRPMLAKLKAIMNNTRGTVILLTARADMDDRDTFLDTFRKYGIDIDRIHVHRAGNLQSPDSPAEKKAVFIRRYLDTNKYNRVRMYDDNMNNLRVFSQLYTEYPDVVFEAYYVAHNGSVHKIKKEITEAEHHTKASGEINRMFRKMGYKKLGSGAEAAVWAKDDETVIKVIMPEDRDGMDAAAKTFYTFYEFCRKNSDQPNLPKFVQVTKNGHHETFEVDGKEYIMIGIERLQPIKEGSMSQALIWIMSDLVSKGYNWERAYKEMVKPETWKFWEPPPKPKDIIKFIKGVDGMTYVKFDVLYTLMLLLYKRGKINKMGWDLHTENVMERKDGTLVITDPWFSSEI